MTLSGANKTMYICISCGYLYNEVKMLQAWSDLSEGWTCPDCNAGKNGFAELVIDPPGYHFASDLNI